MTTTTDPAFHDRPISASTPEAGDDEREALKNLIYTYETIDFAESRNFTTRDAYGVVDAILAAGFRRGPVPADTPSGDGPHSRACGPRKHDHGTDCHPNCQTCHGQAARPTPPEDVAALQARIRQLEAERAKCDGGCDYNSGPEETCSLHGRPVAEVWEALDIRTKRVQELEDQVADLTAAALESATTVTDEMVNAARKHLPSTALSSMIRRAVAAALAAVPADGETEEAEPVVVFWEPDEKRWFRTDFRTLKDARKYGAPGGRFSTARTVVDPIPESEEQR